MSQGSLRYRLLKPIYHTVADGYRTATDRVSILTVLLRRELTEGTAVDASPSERLWLWRHGFTSRSAALFDVDADNHHEYVSDFQHELANDAVGNWGAVVDNKLTYYLLFSPFADRLPDLYGVLDDGTFRRNSPLFVSPAWSECAPTAPADDERAERADAADWVDSYLAEHDALVLKPIYGSGGRGVLVCRQGDDSGSYRVNGTETPRDEFVALVEDLSEYLAWEFVEQADYADRLFPDAANTLRVMTLWDYETDEPFVGGAIHRIGTQSSAPVDNWSQQGLSAEIADDGELSSGAQWLPSEGTVRWFDRHPDTDRRLAGETVPDWSAVREELVEMAAAFPHLPRLGWDVLLTGDGDFKVLEVNAHAATRTLQVHRPLLRDPRVRRFYEHHGCL